jgi:hypothetical protein
MSLDYLIAFSSAGLDVVSSASLRTSDFNDNLCPQGGAYPIQWKISQTGTVQSLRGHLLSYDRDEAAIR